MATGPEAAAGPDAADEREARTDAPRGVPWLALLPLAAFLLFAAVAGYFLLSGRDAAVLPSPLVGQAAPSVDLPALPAAGVPAPADLPEDGRVRLVNAWASWCAPCRAEHAQLMSLANDEDLTLIGLATKDEPEAAARFLAELGNPFDAVGMDRDGRAMIDWGVVKLPETHVVAPDGTVTHKHAGPILPEHMEGLRAAIRDAASR